MLTTMNKEFFGKQETEGFKRLQKLNEDVFHLNNLERRIKKTDKDPIDASGLTFDDRTINIEIKIRDFDYNKFPSLMIETHKAYPLMYEYAVYKRIPLYVNFLTDGSALVFNLARIPEDKQYMKRMSGIQSKGYEDKETSYKLFFDKSVGKHYVKDENGKFVIQRGN